jgi:hypothetical protein
MAATGWSDLRTTGIGKVVYLLEIEGIGVFETWDYEPNDSWFTGATGWNDDATYLHPWLKFDELGPLKETGQFLEGTLDVGEISAIIADIDGGMTSLVQDWKATNVTWLTSSVTAAETTTINVTDTSAFASSGTIYIGQEAIRYTGKTATTFTTLTRGVLATTARAHTVDLATSSGIPDQPVVSDGPHFLTGRRAYLHAAVINPATKVPNNTDVIYRGRIRKGVKIRNGDWHIPIEHISEVFKQKCGLALPQSEIEPGYYMTGETQPTRFDEGKSFATVVSTTGATSAYAVTPDAGFYTPAGLADEWSSKIAALGASIEPEIGWSDGKAYITAYAVAGEYCLFTVDKYDALWFLGFATGIYEGLVNTTMTWNAQSEPIPWGIQWGSGSSGSVEPTFDVKDGSLLTAGLAVMATGLPWAIIDSISTNTVTLKANSQDPLRATVEDYGWAIEKEEDLLLRHVLTVGDSDDGFLTIKEALQRVLYLESGQAEPEIWCAAGAVDEDFDWDELDAALATLPPEFNRWADAITEPIEVGTMFFPLFGLFGIAPRITFDATNGNVIGFKRIETPTFTSAETVLLNDSMWSLISAAELQSRLSSSGNVNVIEVEHSHNYREEGGGGGQGSGTKGWGPPVNIIWRDGFAMLGQTRALKYSLRGLQANLSGGSGVTLSLEALAYLVNRQTASTHFGVFGRETTIVDIPCTWLAKQLEIGDVVRVTHEMVPDTIEGTSGVTDRLGIVVGRTGQTTNDNEDALEVLFCAEINAFGIAPCAHGDSWVVGTLTMTFSAANTPLFEQAGANDLTRFDRSSGTVDVLLIQRDSTSPSTVSATITAGGVDTSAKTVVFSADPFSGGGLPAGGVYMVLPDWDDAASWQQEYAYLADNQATPTLGTGDDAAQEWVT